MTRYVDGVFNRTAGTPGYFNVSDWLRVYGNAQAVCALQNVLGDPVAFTYLTFPTITTIPSVSNFNTLLSTIQTILNLTPLAGEVAIKYDWIAGIEQPAPDWQDVNDWEHNLDIHIKNFAAEIGFTSFVTKTTPHTTRRAKCGVAASNAGLTRANGFVKY